MPAGIVRIKKEKVFIAEDLSLVIRLEVFIAEDLSLVIRLGLEPKTPTLKVLCSTN